MIDPLTSTASPDALASHQLLTQAHSSGPELQGLSDRFNRLMAQEPDPGVYAEQHLSQHGSPASAFVAAQERVMYSTYDEVRKFSIEAPHMNMQDMAARHIDLTYQIAMVSVQYNAGVYMAQSSKSGLQTLMRNQ